MGFFIPACDCAVIPISMRLLKKGVPTNVCVTFMLVSPIVNPVVIIATIYAFRNTIPNMIYYRTGLGIIIAILIGIIISFITKRNEILNEKVRKMKIEDMPDCMCNKECYTKDKNTNIISRFRNVIFHAREEFVDIIKYMLIGAFLASVMQILIPRNFISNVGNDFLQIIVMMIFAYCISLCSTADSFIAKTFIYKMGHKSLLAFLLLGPMIDIKNTIVLLQNYNKKFVIRLISLIFICILIFMLFIKI